METQIKINVYQSDAVKYATRGGDRHVSVDLSSLSQAQRDVLAEATRVSSNNNTPYIGSPDDILSSLAAWADKEIAEYNDCISRKAVLEARDTAEKIAIDHWLIAPVDDLPVEPNTNCYWYRDPERRAHKNAIAQYQTARERRQKIEECIQSGAELFARNAKGQFEKLV